jgi:hypothetical protein
MTLGKDDLENKAKSSIMARREAQAWRTRVLPGMLAAAFALLAVCMVMIHQQERHRVLLGVRARRAALSAKVQDFVALLRHPVCTPPRCPQHACLTILRARCASITAAPFRTPSCKTAR